MREAHRSQTRKHGTPYATHPEAVFTILTHEYPGVVSERMQVIALLHDCLEDTAVEAATLAREFGLDVLVGVQWLTKQRREPFGRYAARLRRAPAEILLVKAADRLHNLREAPLAGDPLWARRYAQQTRRHILPLVKDPWFRARMEEALAAIEGGGGPAR
jgi:guanosine-3',5'-bis(diphosphate) 3'-pyrophosphohydrolase